MKILVINGANMNMLGRREPDIYGKEDYAALCARIYEHAQSRGVAVECFQSNHEGAIIDAIQEADTAFDGIVINPGAYTHYSYAIHDALKAVSIPAVEVHMSDIQKREEFRHLSVTAPACIAQIRGHGFESYSMAIDMLAKLGYSVTALTGKESQSDYLRHLGASDVMLRSSLDLSRIRPLAKALWAGAVDNLGGDVLAWIASSMKQAGTIASIGLAESTTLNTTVMPFVLRGVSLLGIDSGYVGEAYRQRVWQRLATDLHPRHLPELTRTINLDELPDVFDSFLQGAAHGRIVVAVS